MPLTKRVLDWTDGLRRHLFDPSVGVVDIALPSENLEMVERILRGWAAREAGSTVFVGVELESEQGFTRSMFLALAEIVEAVRASPEAMRSGPPPVLADRIGDVGRSVDDAERVALWAGTWISRIVVTLRAPSGDVPEWIRTAFDASGALLVWILLRTENVSTPWTSCIGRRSAALFSRDPDEAQAQLSMVRRGTGPRVLVCDGPCAPTLRTIREHVDCVIESRVVHVSVDSHHPRAIALMALSKLDVLDPIGADPVLELCQAIDRHARVRPLILVIAIDAVDDWRSDVQSLGDALCARVLASGARVVLVGRDIGALPTLASVVAHPLRLDASSIEDDMRECLRSGGSAIEQCRIEISLAAAVSARGEHGEAIERAIRALGLAFSSEGFPALRTSSLMTLGSVLSHAGDLVSSLEAFTRCAWIADERAEPIVVGRALCSIGHLYAGTESFDHAARCYRAACAVAREARDDAGEASAQNGLADVLRRAGNMEDAASLLDAIASMTPTLPHVDSLFATARGQAHARLAALLRDVGLDARAHVHEEAALRTGYHGPVCGCPRP